MHRSGSAGLGLGWWMLAAAVLVLTSLLAARPTMPEGARIEVPDSVFRGSDRIDTHNDGVPVLIFTDYLCPHCLALDTAMSRLEVAVRERLAVHVRSLPSGDSDSRSFSLAVALECATLQGRRSAAHALLSREVSSTAAEWESFGARIAVANPSSFSSCVLEKRTLDAVVQDISVARALGVRGTPGVLFADRLFIGALSEKELRRLIGAVTRRAED